MTAALTRAELRVVVGPDVDIHIDSDTLDWQITISDRRLTVGEEMQDGEVTNWRWTSYRRGRGEPAWDVVTSQRAPAHQRQTVLDTVDQFVTDSPPV
jgi:hypothetical protein